MALDLGDVQTTALIPLVVKANETLRPNARIHDPKAVEIVNALHIDTKRYDKFMSHEGVVARTIMLDRQLQEIIDDAPDTVVVNIGAGFDNRFQRVDNGKIWWVDMDLPDSIAARKKVFLEQDRVTMLAGDALKDDWCETVQNILKGRQARPVFIAEGLFMYFTLEEIRTFLNILRDNFDRGILIAEQNSKMMQKHGKYHDTVSKTNAKFMSGTDSAQEIADLAEGIHLVEEHSFNEEMKKHSIRGKLFALIFPNMNDRWATFEW
ncbi:MAG: class I SAM-dependent methyltransferase [Anaerovibrio sp.]|uniref:class I SAM-dependent methyltransferase n=1 Tax=Anaerovibrio sp. TaxID=1872532 RepID=UPI0025DA67C8|nr:class I SAM-dependent methyltransferase [Anaerovibrio sp.]MCR5175991.1 class I SAM-dependent methyltransferase [Anaerovibrio sp.]